MSQISQLRSIINTSLDAFEAELRAAQLPELSFAPTPHPLDNASFVPSPKLFASQKAAVASLNMLSALIQPAWKSAYEGEQSASHRLSTQDLTPPPCMQVLTGCVHGLSFSGVGSY